MATAPLRSCLLSLAIAIAGATTFGALAAFLAYRRVPFVVIATLACGAAFAGGFLLASFLVVRYIRDGLRLESVGATEHMAITGLMLMIAAFMTFVFTLLIHALALRLPEPLRDDRVQEVNEV